jgi:hypothetical protein
MVADLTTSEYSFVWGGMISSVVPPRKKDTDIRRDAAQALGGIEPAAEAVLALMVNRMPIGPAPRAHGRDAVTSWRG